MSTRLALYSYWRSSASYRVRIALHLKALEFETRPVHLMQDGGQQHSEEYRALNPQGRVPLLVDGDFCLNQSLAIMEWLENRYPVPPLMPKDPKARARMWAFCHTLCSDIQPLQNLGPLQMLELQYGFSAEQKTEWVRHWIQRGLEALEAELPSDAAADCGFGTRPTLADCCLVPQVYNAERYDCDATKYPRLQAIADSLRVLPAFVAAHPDQQPDKPA